MTGYANVKLKKAVKFIKYLSKNSDIKLEKCGRHNYKITYPFWERPFPLPFKHREVNKFIIKDLVDRLLKDDICTEKEIKKYL